MPQRRALIVGGSMSGLLAAIMLDAVAGGSMYSSGPRLNLPVAAPASWPSPN